MENRIEESTKAGCVDRVGANNSIPGHVTKYKEYTCAQDVQNNILLYYSQKLETVNVH